MHPPPCCERWTAYANDHSDVDQATRIVHHLGHHTRTPFTVDAVMDLATCNRVDARRALDVGTRHNWIAQLGKKDKYADSDPDRWIGKL